MQEYRRRAHAVFDLKYQVVWITKYRHKILRGRVAERARDLIRQTCEAREVVIVRGAVSPDHIHVLLRHRHNWHRRNWCNTSRDGHRESYWRNSQNYARGTGASTCGRADIFARRWARWTRQRLRPISRIRNGTTTIKISRLLRPRSLEPALCRDPLQAALAATRLSVGKGFYRL